MKNCFLWVAKDEVGQTAVEYVLLLAIVLILTLALMEQIQERVIGDIDNCRPDSTTIGCQFKRAFPTGGPENFQYYRLK